MTTTMKRSYKLSIVFILFSNSITTAQTDRYYQQNITTYEPLSFEEMLAPAMKLSNKHDQNFKKLEILSDYIYDFLLEESYDDEFYTEMEKHVKTIIEYSQMGLAKMDSEILSLQIDIKKSLLNYRKRNIKEKANKSHEESNYVYMRVKKNAPILKYPSLHNTPDYEVIGRASERIKVIKKLNDRFYKVEFGENFGYMNIFWIED